MQADHFTTLITVIQITKYDEQNDNQTKISKCIFLNYMRLYLASTNYFQIINVNNLGLDPNDISPYPET